MKKNDIDTIKKEYEDLKVEAKENNKVKSGFEEEIKQIEDEKNQIKKELITVKQNYKKDVNDLKKELDAKLKTRENDEKVFEEEVRKRKFKKKHNNTAQLKNQLMNRILLLSSTISAQTKNLS